MKKQFLMIMTDTQRLDMVSCYEDIGVKTPNINALAKSGVKFTKAYTVQPVCGPARSAIFTGQYPCINGAYTNSIAPGLNVKTIGQRLSDKGILTGYIGKWHLDGSDYFGLGTAPDGWDADSWYDMRNYLEELSLEDRVKSRKKTTMDTENLSAEFTFAHRCASRAIDFIRKHAEEDYFLVVSFDEPHGPSLSPEPYASMYKDFTMPKRPNVYDTLENKPVHQQIWSGQRRFQDRNELELKPKALLGCNTFVDSEIGRILSALDELNHKPAILYTTDHGDMLESHSLYAKGPAAYEEICHVPLILSGLGSQQENHTPVSHIDIAPTIWDYFGFEKPMMLQGNSLIPLLSEKAPSERDVFIEFGRYEVDHDGFGAFQPMRCIFDGRYKLVINLLSDDELYDLQNDPYEMNNRISDPSLSLVRSELLDRLLNHMNEIRDPLRGYYWEQRPWNTNSANPTWDYTGFTRQRSEPDYEKPQLDYDTGLVAEPLVRTKIRH